LRDGKVSVSNWSYTATMMAQGAAVEQCEVLIAQISDSFGLGLYRSKASLFNAYGLKSLQSSRIIVIKICSKG
jgi:hypothetical protein